MLRYAGDIEGFTIQATDGEIGTIKDFFFDEDEWTVRYLVVKTDGWLTGKRVLLAPAAVDSISWDRDLAEVGVGRRQIESSPDVDEVKPVSRLQELMLARHYGWPRYWLGDPMMGGVEPVPPSVLEADTEARKEVEEELARAAIRSVDEVRGYLVVAPDGDLGKIRDFALEESDWRIRYLIVDTGGWLSQRRVLMSTRWITGVDWASRRVAVQPERKRVEAAPPWDPSNGVAGDYESRLHAHYGLQEK